MQKISIPESYNYIAAFLTMKCNLNCSFCLNAFDKGFDRKEFEEISGKEWIGGLNRIESHPDIPVTLCGGEPFMHKDFIYIINNIKPKLNIDILTNLQWGKKGVERFIDEVNPERLKRSSPYASIRVSYHPEQMGNGIALADSAKLLQDAGFSIGIWSVLYPSQKQLSAINQMQFICKDRGVDFRLKEFIGIYREEVYGDYSRYSGAAFGGERRECECRTSELLIAPNAAVYRCHRDLFAGQFPVGSILDDNYQINDVFRECSKYGECHPCDIKVKTNYKQQIGHTSVKIQNIK